MVVETNLWLWEQIYDWGNKSMVEGTDLWLWEQNYGKNNKVKVMNKYLGAKYSYILKDK
jgi:hypothetical protein